MARRVRNALGVVPRAAGYYAFPASLRVQVCHFVVCAAQLETEDMSLRRIPTSGTLPKSLQPQALQQKFGVLGLSSGRSSRTQCKVSILDQRVPGVQVQVQVRVIEIEEG